MGDIKTGDVSCRVEIASDNQGIPSLLVQRTALVLRPNTHALVISHFTLTLYHLRGIFHAFHFSASFHRKPDLRGSLRFSRRR